VCTKGVGRRNEKRGWTGGLFGVALQVGAWGKSSRGQRLMPGLRGSGDMWLCDEKLGRAGVWTAGQE